MQSLHRFERSVQSPQPGVLLRPAPGSIGLESGLNFLYGPSVLNFDMALQKEFSVKERVHFQFRIDAFNVFNHTEFSGYNATLNFNGYPTTGGVISGSPTITSTALGRNSNGALQRNGLRHGDANGPRRAGLFPRASDADPRHFLRLLFLDRRR